MGNDVVADRNDVEAARVRALRVQLHWIRVVFYYIHHHCIPCAITIGNELCLIVFYCTHRNSYEARCR